MLATPSPKMSAQDGTEKLVKGENSTSGGAVEVASGSSTGTDKQVELSDIVVEEGKVRRVLVPRPALRS